MIDQTAGQRFRLGVGLNRGEQVVRYKFADERYNEIFERSDPELSNVTTPSLPSTVMRVEQASIVDAFAFFETPALHRVFRIWFGGG